jgi:hypothetical protein
MTIPAITVKNGASSVISATGGTDLVFTPAQPGLMPNLSAGLTTPMYLALDNTYRPEGGESSYLFKLVQHKQRTNPDATDESDAKAQAHLVLKGEIKDWSETELQNLVFMLVQAVCTPGVLTRVLRGDK